MMDFAERREISCSPLLPPCRTAIRSRLPVAGCRLPVAGGVAILEFRRARRSREWDYVADVFHAGQVHHHALQSQSEAGVRGRSVLTQIEIPLVVVFVEA